MTLLRYTGSKAQLAPAIVEMIGKPTLYVEPFLGAAHVALMLPVGTSMLLADAQPLITNFWRWVQCNPYEVHSYVERICGGNYASLRTQLNAALVRGAPLDAYAAALLHVVQARCFNGVMRVNQAGLYNVPEGKTNAAFADRQQFILAAERLRNAEIICYDGPELLQEVRAGDDVTIYADPPYFGQHSAYTKDGFDDVDHESLGYELRQHAARGTRVLVSNSDCSECDAWYAGFKKHLLYPTRSVGGKRGAKAEALWTANV